jgi:DNA-binding response OmpR family regulator
MHKILLVEDDIDYGTVMQQYLEISGFEVIWLTTPENTLDMLKKEKFSLAVLDIMLPVKDGFSLSKEIQMLYPALPFLFLTAKNQNIDRLMGLKSGAADYISKTCDPEELKLRIDNILKYAESAQTQQYQLGNYSFYPFQLKLTHPKESFRLTERERDLLILLIQNNNKIVHRNVILEKIWHSSDYFSGRSMDVFITRLRKYFIHDDNIQITSIRGIGFEIDLALK